MDEWSGLGMAAGGGASAGGAVAMMLRHWLSKLSNENREMRNDIDLLKRERIARLETAVAKVSEICSSCGNGHRIDSIEPLLRKLGDKMDHLSQQVARLETGMESVNARAGRTSDSLVRHIESHAAENKQLRRGNNS